MNILKSFTLIDINIQGTIEKPLFQIDQIAQVLNKNIHKINFINYDDDEKVGDFLTELGLYKLLGRCRKPIASKFKKWVYKVVSELKTIPKPVGVVKPKSKPKKLREQLTSALTKLDELKTQIEDAMPGNCPIVSNFVKDKVKQTNSQDDILRIKDAWREYKAYITAQDKRLGYAVFAENMEQHLGKCVAKSGAVRSFWRGWKIL